MDDRTIEYLLTSLDVMEKNFLNQMTFVKGILQRCKTDLQPERYNKAIEKPQRDEEAEKALESFMTNIPDEARFGNDLTGDDHDGRDVPTGKGSN